MVTRDYRKKKASPTLSSLLKLKIFNKYAITVHNLTLDIRDGVQCFDSISESSSG